MFLLDFCGHVIFLSISVYENWLSRLYDSSREIDSVAGMNGAWRHRAVAGIWAAIALIGITGCQNRCRGRAAQPSAVSRPYR